MLVRFNKRTIIGGTIYTPESGEVELANDIADQVVAAGNGVVVGFGAYSNEARLSTDSNGNTVLVGADGAGVLKGPMISGVWFSSPSVFRLRITGTGTVQLDSRNSAGIVTAVATYTVSGATDQIEFPYAGDSAVAIRATLTGTATAEVI